MLNKTRQNIIIDMLNQNKSVQIPDLTEKFNVSVATIRRDLKELEDQNLLKRTYGGAVCADRPALQPYFPRINRHKEQKEMLGAAAAALVNEGDTIILDIGTTALEVAKSVKKIKNLTVITNSLPILTELESADNIQLFSLGGQLHSKMHAMTGSIAEHALSLFCVDKAFIGVAGISLEYGLTNFNQESAQLCAAVIKRAKKSILVADSSKFGKANFAVVGKLDSVDAIITDEGIPDQYKSYLENNGVEVILATK